MLISYKWLQSYFDAKLPPPEKLAELLTFSFAEIEGVEKKGEDTIFDIKVLPDRACYALSHRGVAYEVAAITGLKKKTLEWPQPAITKVRPFDVRVEASDLCSRYMARVIENVAPKAMDWVKEHLEAAGQKSINPIVDGANIVMFDMGQPLHAFDADRVEGGIIVRMARKGEKITTLDNREVALDESVLLIADEEGPLALAGIKGGKKAEVTAATRNLILESANFDASYVRKASERLGIKTDASKRFENRLSPSLASTGMRDFTAYLYEMDKNISVGEIIDAPQHHSDVLKNIRITPKYICEKLGCMVTETDIEKVLSRLAVAVKKEKGNWLLTPPAVRVDLAIPEDIAEEIGRLIGYDNIPSVLPPKPKGAVEIPKLFYYEWKIREILIGAGFSEIMTASFSSEGEVVIEKPLAENKKYARENLRSSFEKTLKANALNAPLFGTDEIRIFEIGQTFTKEGEETVLAIGVSGPKKKIAGVLEAVVKMVSAAFGTELKGEGKNGVFEVNLNRLFEKLPEPKKWDISILPPEADTFVPCSIYPFIVRDIALFVGVNDLEEKVRLLVFEMAKKSAGKLLIKDPLLFDTFEKGGKRSLAFRLVFQSFERTLTDEEVNGFMDKIYSAVKNEEWEVR